MRTLPPRETIDIEALLVRAYREKKLDRLPADPRRLLGRGRLREGAESYAKALASDILR